MVKVLVADDDLETLEFLKVALEMRGHEVTTVSNGQQALEVGESLPFDLYLLDVTMPFVNGYEVSKSLSQKFPERKILLLTSRDFQKDQKAIESCGATAHMAKPFDFNELLETINGMTGNSPS